MTRSDTPPPARLADDLLEDLQPHLRRYEVLDRVGRGGMATVFRARDRDTGKIVAVKLIPKGGVPDKLLQRFRREATAAAGRSHPHIVKIFDVGEEEGSAYIVMELVEGPRLAEAMPDTPRNELVGHLAKVARAAHAAHEDGVVHRDIKPGNILLTTDGEPKLIDFGLAYLIDTRTRLTRTGSKLGTPVYMAPEQVRAADAEIDRRADVYALGAILYEILTGTQPHTSESVIEVFGKILNETPAKPSDVGNDVPADLERICLKAISKLPGDRHACAEDFAKELETFLGPP